MHCSEAPALDHALENGEQTCGSDKECCGEQTCELVKLTVKRVIMHMGDCQLVSNVNSQ